MGFSRQEYWSGVPLPPPPQYLGHAKNEDHGIQSHPFMHGKQMGKKMQTVADFIF